MKVIYLGYYNSVMNVRNCSPAATTMMDYVAEAIDGLGYKVTIVSPASCNKKNPFVIEKKDEVEIIYLPTYGETHFIFMKLIRYISKQRQLIQLLENMIDDNTILLVYHSMLYINILKRLRKRKKFRMILQVNEIYSDVKDDKWKRKTELAWINSADAYMFSTDLLSSEIVDKRKPYLVCLGTYKEELVLEGNNKGKEEVHVIYAGTFDSTKGGVQCCLQCRIPSFKLSFTHMWLWK